MKWETKRRREERKREREKHSDMKIVNVGFHLLNLISHFVRRLFVYRSSLICFNEDVFARQRDRPRGDGVWVVVQLRYDKKGARGIRAEQGRKATSLR